MLQDPQARTGTQGFTLIELLVVVAIIAILAGLLLPAISMVKESAISGKCRTHVRQFYLATEAYASDNEGLLVATSQNNGSACWGPLLNNYLTEVNNWGSITSKTLAWGCPAWRGRDFGGGIATTSPGYGMNKHPTYGSVPNPPPTNDMASASFQFSAIPLRGQRMLFADWNDWHIYYGGTPSATNYPTIRVLPGWVADGGPRHKSGMNIVFFDGHAASVPLSKAGLTFANPAAYSP